MAIYDKAPSAINFEDLHELLAEQAVENVRLEFKSQIPDDASLLKKLSSFANTYGGILVIGAAADSKTGRIVDLQGVTQRAGYKQTIIQICSSKISPPLVVHVSDPIVNPHVAGNVFYTIFVEASENAPHFINGRQGLWVRTDEYSHKRDASLADESEIRLLLNRREKTLIFREEILARSLTRFIKFMGPLSSVPILQLSIGPRYPSWQACDQSALRQIVSSSEVGHRGGVRFPSTNGSSSNWESFTQHESYIASSSGGGVERFQYLEANVWGLLFAAFGMGSNREGEQALHQYQIPGKILVFLKFAAEFYTRTGVVSDLEMQLKMTDIRGIPLHYFPEGFPGMYEGSGSIIDESFMIRKRVPCSTLREDFAEPAESLVREIYFALNLPGASNLDVKQAIAGGFRYNQWAK